MKLGKQSGFALLLIICGALILLGKFGFIMGHLMSYLIPLAMVFLGYMGFRNGRKIVGLIIMTLGVVILLGKLAGLLGIVIAIGLIGYGISLLTKRSAY